jgi:hypothetical protein
MLPSTVVHPLMAPPPRNANFVTALALALEPLPMAENLTRPLKKVPGRHLKGSSGRCQSQSGEQCLLHVNYVDFIAHLAPMRRISNWTSQMIYDIQDLPRNRLPEIRSVARVLGAVLHITHLVVRYTKLRRLKDEDIGWEDMLGEIDMPGAPSSGSWVDWVRQSASLTRGIMFIIRYSDYARVNAAGHPLHIKRRVSLHTYQILPLLP